jgi:hypothetical protein
MSSGPSRPPPRGRQGRPQRLAFEADPANLIVPIAGSLLARLAPSPEQPSHIFRVLRPDDLVVFDVAGYHLELRMDGIGPALVPANPQARLEVRFAFQHLGERAFYRAVPPPAPEAAGPPPIEALAAQPSRLVFDVPVGERIDYSIEGVLAAMSRLPLRVAPLATPKVISGRAGVSGFGELVDLVATPGGFILGRTDDGRLALTTSRRAPVGAGRASPAHRVIAEANAVRASRSLLVNETAVDLSRRVLEGAVIDPSISRASPVSPRLIERGVGGLVVRPGRRLPRVQQRPREPRADETAIEAPFRLVVSPSREGGFAHSTVPVTAPGDAERVELWHTRLGVRAVDEDDGSVHIDESRHPQRAIRAIWARDKSGLDPNADAPQGETPFRMSLNPRDRVILVRQSSDPLLAPPQPVDVDRLFLSSLGAYLDLHGRWANIQPYASRGLASIEAWDHDAPMGRDQYVRVVYPGYLFPFGHRCALVKVTERKILDVANPQAYLYQRKFLVVSQPVRTFNDRWMPFKQVTLRPMVTPDIADPLDPQTPDAPGGEELFWPVVGNQKFRFTLDCLDHEGHAVRLQAPLLFIAAHLPFDQDGRRAEDIRKEYRDDPERPIAGQGQAVAFAESSASGDTSFETVTLRFEGQPGDPGSLTSTPRLTDADIVVPAMRHLAPSAPQTTVSYAEPYVDFGFGGKNAEAQVIFALKSVATISFGQGTDRSGGFVQPDLPVRGLSRALGAVGDIVDLVEAPAAQKFNPEKFLAGVLPKLFGLFELTDILAKLGGLDAAPSFITEKLDRIAALLADLEALEGAVDRGVTRLGQDAAGAPTSALQAQAQVARARLQAVQAQLQPRVDELVGAIEALLDLSASSTLADVTTAVAGALATISDQVTELRSTVREQPMPPPVKAEIERLINSLEPALAAAEIAHTIEAIAQFVNGFDPTGLGVRARFDWRPVLTNYPDVPDDQALFIVRPDGFLLSVEARASGTDGVGADVLAELREFALNLFPSAPLMRLAFDRIAFRAASGRKPEVDVVFRGIEFVGILSFIETLKRLIPFDAFADPPYLDVSADGVVAGFDVALPSTAVGVFSLENISLGADARVPFLGHEALTIGFNFCTRDKPFRLTVMAIGGGGFVGIRLSPRGLVILEMALEAGASLSINLGVASGSVSVMVGVYLRLEADAGSLTGYFRIRGQMNVLGLISASITLELALKYEFATGKLVGRASVVVEIDLFFFSASVKVTCERRLAGSNGDPTFEQVIGVEADGTSPAWSQYCAAFAEV